MGAKVINSLSLPKVNIYNAHIQAFILLQIFNYFCRQNFANQSKLKMSNITFTMIKPTAFDEGHAGKILDMIIQAGFRIKALKLTRLTKYQAEAFYAVHQERPFFDGLVNSMSSGPIIAAILEKDNAVADYRRFIGATDPAEAAEGSIRKLFGKNIQANAVHGSDSDENARIEAGFFFSNLERF